MPDFAINTRGSWAFLPDTNKLGDQIMRVFLLIVVTLFSFQTFACEDERKLKWIEEADPIHDAKKAVKDGDERYAVIYSYTYMAPGVGGQESDIIASKNFFAIDGTSDDLCSDLHKKRNDMAFEYAKKHNEYLLFQQKSPNK